MKTTIQIGVNMKDNFWFDLITLTFVVALGLTTIEILFGGILLP